MNGTPPPIKGEPEKDVFISMITKDISLEDAILDLVDNSVDAARAYTEDGEPENATPGLYDGLEITLSFDSEHFQIQDNCGGFDTEEASNYAFRFGRTPGHELQESGIGQFGVGMKRAIFKLGNHFRVESTTPYSHFVVEENVDEWAQRTGWEWKFEEYDPDTEQGKEDVGTIIRISELHPEISQHFSGTKVFERKLRKIVRSTHSDSLRKGLTLKVNDFSIPADDFVLKTSDSISPGYYYSAFDTDSDESIKVNMFTGISDSKPKEAGWYVFCNGRMILEADQSDLTVWGEVSNDISVPKIHNQFSMFRGYIFFDSEDQTVLPWTTTKRGVDRESQVYQKMQHEMIHATRPVIDFLNELDKEKDQEQKLLTEAVQEMKKVSIYELIGKTVSTFSVDRKLITSSMSRKMGTISYKKPQEVINEIKEYEGLSSHKEVGEVTFDYYCESEGFDAD